MLVHFASLSSRLTLLVRCHALVRTGEEKKLRKQVMDTTPIGNTAASNVPADMPVDPATVPDIPVVNAPLDRSDHGNQRI